MKLLTDEHAKELVPVVRGVRQAIKVLRENCDERAVQVAMFMELFAMTTGLDPALYSDLMIAECDVFLDRMLGLKQAPSDLTIIH